jgi:hypothetical protein
VVAEMKDIICLNIDAESETGAPIAKRYGIRGYPALLLLSSDGKAEDQIGGYLPPDAFKKEIQRVRSGKGTASDLRNKVAANGSDLKVRFELASKLKSLGDTAGHDAQIAEIRKLDPQGKSLPMRQIAFQEVSEKINAGFQKNQTVNTSLMTAFLEEETHPELLFQGWSSLGQMHGFLGKRASDAGDDAAADEHQGELRSAMRMAWKYVPTEQVVGFGNSLAWTFYEARDALSADDKAFALEVAAKAAETSKDDVNVLDTYACCLAMNGKKDEAIRQVQRCIELDPENQQWKDRLVELQT